MSAGKGDAPRKVDGNKYRDNYDKIFGCVGVETCNSCEEKIGNSECEKCWYLSWDMSAGREE